MKPVEAKKLLRSSRQRDRLAAARFYYRHAVQEDIDDLQRALSSEKVSWIRTALSEAITRATLSKAAVTRHVEVTPEPEEEYDANEIYSEAVKQTTSQLIHEIEPILAAIKLSASEEIDPYSESITKRNIENLDKLLEAMAALRRAAFAPRLEEFDLAELIRELVGREQEGGKNSEVRVEFGGAKPFVIVSDAALISLCVANGVRNGLEATSSLGKSEEAPPITISWGRTDKDYWVSVVDQGIGFHGNFDKMANFGTTTKPDHLGMGLPTAKQAALSLGGNVQIFPREEAGVRFEFRWPRRSTAEAPS